MQKIVPHLWFDKEVKEAVEFYTSLFDDAKITAITTIDNTPSGSVDVIAFKLAGQEFMSINGGPYFKFTPAISFMVSCSTKDEVTGLWNKLSPKGTILMELGKYPFSELYGWINDKYGLSWQIIYTKNAAIQQKIVPSLMFVGTVHGKAEHAMRFYTSVFHDSSIDIVERYTSGEAPDIVGTVKYAAFTIEKQNFIAMDSAYKHAFSFNEAVSFMVYCDTQKEIDYSWDKLSYVPDAEQCGWLKDKYGISWQITPTIMNDMMAKGNKDQIARVTKAFLKMKKFDISTLIKAYESK